METLSGTGRCRCSHGIRIIPLLLMVVIAFGSLAIAGSLVEASSVETGPGETVYSADSVTVTFDPNGGTVTETTSVMTYTASSSGTITLTLGHVPTATRTGYVFAGWFVGSYDDPLGFIPEDPYSSQLIIAGGTVDDIDTWYAVWFEPGMGYAFSSREGYTELELHGYSAVPEGSFVFFDYGYEDYTCEGGDWMRFQRYPGMVYIDHGYGFAEAGEDVVIKGYGLDSMTTTIHVIPGPKSVQFVSNGTVLETMAVDSGSTVVAPEDPELYGYVFMGWYTSDGREFDFTTAITEDITLYARWDGVLQFTTDPVSDGKVTALRGLPGTVAFSAASSRDYTSVMWDFGDGETSDNLYATHYYCEPGVYTATLTVYNNYGYDVTTYTIEVPENAAGGGGQ